MKVFSSMEFGEIQVLKVNNKEYFEATRSAEILGYTNPRDAILRYCNEDGVEFFDVMISAGKRKDNSEIIKCVSKKFIDEGNLYRLIVRSKKKEANKFERWVMEDVLPTIRSHKAYIQEDLAYEIINNPKVTIDLAKSLLMEKEKVEKLQNIISMNKPYVKIGETVGECSDAISIGAYAKLLNSMGMDIGRTRLFDWLRVNGYLMNQGRETQPKQIYIDKGLFKTRLFAVNTNHGTEFRITTYITGKGQEYFTKILQGGYRDEKNIKYI
ncbi:phage repressor protein/antirepressor Ant [Romboutsia weinsteinii]|uniref:Phage repressor protein/antirepressor Ant n=1 Tax=Romboutsia weinsteinii TaxID=2020949 RepID=A0A371J4X1_9FIRM|nr:phage antirepressor KilAC domain-containing protein [Romboutsia weinsteinii]RDY27841.1 phage repressor protein/antirepressor Ant [Romboutsia weinsteinii]